MKLNFEQIKSIATGVVEVTQENGRISFSRFTEEQIELYEKASIEQDRKFNERCTATAGVRLRFKTNSQKLKLAVEVSKCTSRTYFSFDVFVNGKAVGYLDNFSGVELPVDYTEFELQLGKFEKEFALGTGDKEVCIYFPWSVCPVLEELCVDDGAYISAVKPDKKLLAFGDSITQGYDAMRPSVRYVSCLADRLGVEEINKGIGGEIFFPDLAKTKDAFSPDYITVAYGTNDWSKETESSFKVRCRDFYAALCDNYPKAQIFAITPIWRKDFDGQREFGPFENVEADIRNAVSDLTNVTVISGVDLVPKNENYFADLRLHPNDAGFGYYGDNLFREISKVLERGFTNANY